MLGDTILLRHENHGEVRDQLPLQWNIKHNRIHFWIFIGQINNIPKYTLKLQNVKFLPLLLFTFTWTIMTLNW